MSEDKKYILTDNFRANLFLLPVTATLYLFLIKEIGGFERIGIRNSVYGLIEFLIQFSVVYILSSRFYSPDLDHPTNRPGKAHFPLGKSIVKAIFKIETGLIKRGGVLRILSFSITLFLRVQRIIALTWYWIWHPLAMLLTHRGVIHLPIIGVLVRNFYLVLLVFLLSKFLELGVINGLSLDYHSSLSLAKSFLNPEWSRHFILICVPIFLADINHSAIDGYDSLRQGYSFCPPGIPRGLLAQSFRIIFRKKI